MFVTVSDTGVKCSASAIVSGSLVFLVSGRNMTSNPETIADAPKMRSGKDRHVETFEYEYIWNYSK